MFSVHKEAIIAVVCVIIVDKTCEEADIGVFWLRRCSHCRELLLRRQETAETGKGIFWIKQRLRSPTPESCETVCARAVGD
jgi:hypothetical protein